MNLSIGRVSFGGYNYVTSRNLQSRQKSNGVPFKGSFNTARAFGYTFIAAAMLSLASCNNNRNKTDKDVVTTVQTDIDIQPAQVIQEPEAKIQSVKIYHYDPTDEPLTPENYSWSETQFPDGSVEKDSLGYQISITADGKRKSIHTETDETGNTTTTIIYPDSTKFVRTDYITYKPGEILFTETKYRSNGSMAERRYYNEYTVEDSTNVPQIKTEQSIHRFNDKDILIMWDSSITDSLRSADYNEYDKKGRIIYDDLKQERYEYKGESKTPYRSVSECDDCQRIKMYNPEGAVIKDFFKASDGTITEVTDSIM